MIMYGKTVRRDGISSLKQKSSYYRIYQKPCQNRIFHNIKLTKATNINVSGRRHDQEGSVLKRRREDGSVESAGVGAKSPYKMEISNN